MDRKNKRTILVAVCVFAVLIAAFALIYAVGKPSLPETGEKTISITLDFGDGRTEDMKITTASENLRGALESVEGLIKGNDSGSFFITAVRDVTADSTKQQWWCITKNGEMLMTGAEDTLIADGEKYEITLKTGYDF